MFVLNSTSSLSSSLLNNIYFIPCFGMKSVSSSVDDDAEAGWNNSNKSKQMGAVGEGGYGIN